MESVLGFRLSFYLALHLKSPESVALLPSFGPIEGQKWFDQISGQWESQKNRFLLIYFGKNLFLCTGDQHYIP